MNKQLLNRRDFNGLCVALGSSLALVGPAGVALSSAPARAATHTIKLHDGTIVPALGPGLGAYCSECHTAIAAEPIRSSTTLPTAASSRICCHGASGIACR